MDAVVVAKSFLVRASPAPTANDPSRIPFVFIGLLPCCQVVLSLTGRRVTMRATEAFAHSHGSFTLLQYSSQAAPNVSDSVLSSSGANLREAR